MTNVQTVSQPSAADRETESRFVTALGRGGPLFAGIWLFFLLTPLLEGWSRRDEAAGVLGMVCTVAFAGVYMSLWVSALADRQRLVHHPALSWSLGHVGALIVLGALTVFFVGEPGLACVVYVSAACVTVFPLRLAAPIVVLLILGTLSLGAREDWAARSGRRSGSWRPRSRSSACAR